MLDEKEIIKTNKELVELHKRCLITYFVQGSVKLKTRRKFFKLYDIYINHKNIKQFFFRELDLFVLALVTDRLDEISDYIIKQDRLKKKGKKKHVR